MSASLEHPSIGRLLEYWLHETDRAATDAVDEHLMRCDACGTVLAELLALRDGLRDAFRAGLVRIVASESFVQRLAWEGLKIREYRLPHNGSVNCTATAEDDLLVSRLEAPLRGVQRLDVVARLSIEPGVEHRLEDVPFDAGADHVLLMPKMDVLRTLPAHTMEITLLAVAQEATQVVGRYIFCHSPSPKH